MRVVKSSLSAVAVAVAALTIFNAAASAETAAEVPKNSYYDDPLTQAERSGIAQEENVLPSDGQVSVPPAQDDGVVPDSAIDQAKSAPQGPPPTDEELNQRGDDEANVVIQDSKRNFKVTHKSMEECMKDWGPQTQMTKEEWAASCRTTLEYFPDGQ